MSKRRMKKIEKPDSEHKKTDEKKVEKKPEVKKEKVIKPGNSKMFVVGIVIAIVFFATGFFVGPMVSGPTGTAASTSDNQLIFISPPGCTNCDEMEPLAREVADDLGISFVKTGFAQEMETPGFVLLYDDNFLGATGFDSEYSLKTQVCLLSADESICEEAQALQPPEPPEQPTPTVVKSDNPEAHAFVMSYCPYGLQFLKAYIPVIELLGDKASIEVNFVHYLMHGEEEMDENTRMYCIQEEQNDKFTDYLRCFVKEGDYEGCITEVGIDSDALDTCMQTTDEEFELTKTFTESTDRYPGYAIDAALAQAYGVGGSPTFGINGQQVSVSRSSEAIKQAICAAFNTPPEECQTALSSASEAPSFGPVGAGSGTSGSDAQC